MKINSLKLGFLALTIGALAPLSGHAETTYTVPGQWPWHSGDLFIGLYNSSSEFILDLGPSSQFNFSQDFTISGASGSLGSDLSNLFGPNWYTATGSRAISWALADDNELATIDPVSGTVQSAAYVASQGWGANVNRFVHGMDARYNNDADYPPTDGGATVGLFEAAGTSGGWTYATSQSNSPAGVGLGTTASNTFYDVNGVLDGGTPEILGSFTLDNSGDLAFTTAAVPEPSTWASIALGAVTLIGLGRRRLRA